LGNFKGRYIGRIGRQNWKSLRVKGEGESRGYEFSSLKIPGPISQAKPKPIKKNCPLQKRKKIKWRSGDFTKKKIAFG
jgi:hypothetical protein